MSTLGSGGSGLWYIRGLPFTARGNSNYDVIPVGYFGTLLNALSYLTATTVPGTNTLLFRGTATPSTAITSLPFSSYVTTNTEVVISGTYATN